MLGIQDDEKVYRNVIQRGVRHHRIRNILPFLNTKSGETAHQHTKAQQGALHFKAQTATKRKQQNV
jgi:hypothetical protein